MIYNFKKNDSKIYNLIKKENLRQKEGLILIPSENYASLEVLAAMATPLNNKYSEGYPGKRYYSGNKFIDEIEKIAIERAKIIFKAEHANVQPHSGSQANEAAYLALLKPRDRVLSLDLAAGGHLSHGAKFNFSGKFYNFFHYGVDKKTEKIDFKEVEKKALKYKPRLIIASTTSYSRTLDFKKFRKIADKVGAYLLADIAHIAGLVVAGFHPNPFPFADVVTTTTQKTLRGPRGGLILCKNRDRFDKKSLAEKIDLAVFPGIQGGPFEHVIAAKAICFLEATKPGFKKYQKQIILNAKIMAEIFKKEGFRVISGGTDNHLFVIDISSTGMSSLFIQNELEKINIFVNRNKIPFDERPAFNPSGIRIGVPAITTRGLKEKEAGQIAYLICRFIKNIKSASLIKKPRKELQKFVKNFQYMIIFNGKKEADNILKDLKNKIKKQGKRPVLIIIFVGENHASKLYIKNKKIAAKKIGIIIFCYKFKEKAKEKDIIEKINKNNNYNSVDGIIVQLPLPKKLNTGKIINSVDPKKDVDGFNETNRSLLKKDKQYFVPVLPEAILIALKNSSQKIKNKKIFVFCNSDLFGKTLKNFFKNKGIKIQYFIKNRYSSVQIKLKMKKADIVISVCGDPGFISGEMIKKNAVLIDAGISFINGKVKGDIDKESVKEKALFLTPVPGGIGPLTVALLLKNVYKASRFNMINS